MAHAFSIPNPSQSAQILAWLQAGKTLTALEALNEFGCSRLAARVSDLTSQGHRIQSRMISVTNRDGKKCRVAQYSMMGQIDMAAVWGGV